MQGERSSRSIDRAPADRRASTREPRWTSFGRMSSRRGTRRRRRTLPAVGALLLAALVAACGGGDGGERSAAEGVVREYVDALVRGDGAEACRRMTEEVRAAFEARSGTEGCAAAFADASQELGEEQRRLLEDARITIDEIDGDLGRGTIAVEGDLSTPVEVRKVDGRWRFATPPRGS